MDELLAGGLQTSVNLPQNLIANVTLLYSPDAEKIGGKDALYGLNRESAIEEIFELGSTINEADRFIKNQTELMTISENSGFRKILKKSSATMTLE
jgi:predicted P-loop ATPase/GTPase